MSGNANETSAPPSARFVERFRAAAGASGRLRFDAFVRLALYDPEVGYYQRARTRVGRSAQADFYTATSSGGVFAELVVEACRTLLPVDERAASTFVEIGAEPGGGILRAGASSPFRGTAQLRLGDTLHLPPQSIVVSNELFDAQPFRRVVRSAEGWVERGVEWDGGRFTEVTWAEAPTDLARVLPHDASPGYVIDVPEEAVKLARQIASQAWKGLFIAFDYGKSWAELTQAHPRGTARAYFRHQQEKELLARPGEQDLTCHVCWDWLAAALADHGFTDVTVQSQEAFFMRHSGAAIERLVTAEAAHFSERKMALMQLLHPGNMGQKFQVLWGRRRS